jgi:predicted nucleic acid-binding protein
MVTTAGRLVFVDTNVLVYSLIGSAPQHADARAVLDELKKSGAELWISRQVIREYIATVTRPQSWMTPLPIATVTADVVRFQTDFRIAEDGPAVTTELLNLLARITSQGKQIHDANIVATMLAHGVPNLLTHNTTDFARFAGVITVLPLVPPAPPPVPAPPPLPPTPPPVSIPAPPPPGVP